MDNKDWTASLEKDPVTGRKLISKQEIQINLNVGERTLQRWRSEGKLTYYTYTKPYRYFFDEVMKIIKDSRCGFPKKTKPGSKIKEK